MGDTPGNCQVQGRGSTHQGDEVRQYGEYLLTDAVQRRAIQGNEDRIPHAARECPVPYAPHGRRLEYQTGYPL